MTDILMPALSPTMEEGTLSKWHVKEGDTVSAGDVIAEIETDKATMEVEAVDEGVIEAILVKDGTEGVKVNTPIARLKDEGGASAPAKPPAEAPKASESKSAAAEPAAKAPPTEAPKPAPQAAAKADGARVFASPLARRLAEQKGIDLSAVRGSGPHGRIVQADVDAAKPGQASAKSGATDFAKAPPAQVKSLESLGIAPGSYDLIPLDGMRRTIAKRLTESFRDIPHFPLSIDLEIDRLLDARARINAALEKQGVKVSVNDLLIKASAAALKAVPEANASFSPEGIAMHHHADIAVAVAIEGGLITPIIREAENRTLADISKAMKDLAERARSRKLKPEEFQGGTFSLSNLGMFGIKNFSSIINEPQGCILSVGAGEKRPVVHGDQLAIATVMSVTLTCDHRVVDGATGARWVQAFKGFVEDPITLLA
ncbi:pyruvate dehydrogenase complex dihydrolipoamide acetyltransferase [Caulobacter sp. S45]|uniref:pyruvate dehydrogenase complex dihydrolipoamide acetyltransferase n=1 Tax=Caulobacter sp. S45 TaxID=1641861 RepID=UPI0020B11D6D|nr:pyruvate dehydrogenase complex dihydrolipoamide acetyltransferase [Caulobacter sp. S45]